jgi:hypothetical protein
MEIAPSIISYIYATKTTAFSGLKKIGKAKVVKARLSSLNTGCKPKPHQVVAVAPTLNRARDEKIAHAHFAAVREEGEFFRLTDEEVQTYFETVITERFRTEMEQLKDGKKFMIEKTQIKKINNKLKANDLVCPIHLKRQFWSIVHKVIQADQDTRENGHVEPPDAKKAAESAKKVWLITYGAAGPSINNEMLHSDAKMTITECYTLTQRDFKYTLMKLAIKVRKSAIEHAMECMRLKHDVVLNDITDFESIASNADGETILDHPGLKLMIEKMNTRSSEFQWWLASGDIKENKKGLLWKHYVESDPSMMGKQCLVDRVVQQQQVLQQQDKEISDLRAEKRAAMARIEELERENGELERKVKDLKSELMVVKGLLDSARSTLAL